MYEMRIYYRCVGNDVAICLYFAEVSAIFYQSIPLLRETSRTFWNVLETSGDLFTFILVVTLEICETGI
jgi:hypothetical protein